MRLYKVAKCLGVNSGFILVEAVCDHTVNHISKFAWKSCVHMIEQYSAFTVCVGFEVLLHV